MVQKRFTVDRLKVTIIYNLENSPKKARTLIG